MLFKSREGLENAVRDLFSEADAATFCSLIRPAVAVVGAETTTNSWVRGGALLPEGMAWPSVDGNHLIHTARIDLSDVPVVSEHQPETGHLSFFDGYPWIDFRDPDAIPRYAAVVYTSDESLVAQQFPLDPKEHSDLYLDGPTYVEFAGPYWTIPTSDAVIELLDVSHGDDALYRLSEMLDGQIVDRSIEGQLFGNVASIQNHPTPKPRNLGNDVTPTPDAWDHLATFRDGSGVFEYYFSVMHRSLVDRTFDTIWFELQCD